MFKKFYYAQTSKIYFPKPQSIAASDLIQKKSSRWSTILFKRTNKKFKVISVYSQIVEGDSKVAEYIMRA